jgi:serine/threonine-protein kinase
MLAAGLGLGVVFTVVWPRDTAQGPSPRRVSAQLGTDATLVTFQFGQANAVTLSRDGGTMAFVAQATGAAPRQIYVRRREELQARPISGTDGALNPFFSPDGRWIGFFADAKLKKVPTEGGGAVTICAVPSNRGGAWGEDDRITFAPVRGGAPLWQVSSSPGEPVPVTTLVDDEVTHRWPQMLDGGRTVLFTANSRQDGFQNANIVVQSLPNGPRKVIVPGAYFGRYLPTGHLLYVHDATVFAARFDLDRLESVGTPVPVLEGVTVNAPVGAAEIAFSDEGTVAYLPAPEQVNYMDAPIEWMDRSGKTTTLRPTPVRWLSPRFSRDGRRLAFDVFDGKQADVWIYDVARDGLTRLTIDQGQTPVWTPDASRIAFQSVRGNARVSSLFWQRSDGVGEPQRLTTGARSQRPGSWHPDGRVLAFTEVDAATGTSSIMTLRLDGDEQSGWRPAEPGILQKDGDEPMFSPEGRWLAYSARSSSPVGTDVFIRPFPGTGGPWQISTGGGWNPVWSSRRAELFYSTPDTQIMVTSYSVSGGSFRHDKPRVLPDSRFNRRPGPLSRSFDVHPDGDRFVLAKVPASEAKRDHIIFFYNFFDELRRLAPSGH